MESRSTELTSATDLVRESRASSSRETSAEVVPQYEALDKHLQRARKLYNNPTIAAVAAQISYYESTLTADQRRRRSIAEKEKPWYLIDPRTSKFMGYWDFTTSLALLFTALVTPVEVAFVQMPEDRWRDPLFLINRVIDVVFVVDVCFQFVLMYAAVDNDNPSGERWVKDPREIAKRYVRSFWFYVDMISIGTSLFDIFAPQGGAMSRLKALRAIRVLRLFKLLRVLNASRVFERWEKRLSINYQLLSIIRLLFGLLFGCHLFACMWGLQASFDHLASWTGPDQKGFCQEWSIAETCPEGRSCNELTNTSCADAGTLWLYSFYFSLATVTSIGYGDISATDTNPTEQIVCIVIMLIGALTFSYLIGNFCALASALSPDLAEVAHRKTQPRP